MEISTPPSTGTGDLASMTRGMARGSEEDYRRFHDLYFHRLLRYLIVVTRGDEHAARDALQEALVRVARHVRSFESEPSFWAWLTRVARSAAVDAGRRESRFRRLLGRFREQSLPPHMATPGEPEDERPLLEHMLRCLPLLDAGDREVLEAKYLRRTPVRELARQLELTEKAVESRLTRARNRLRTLILRSIRDENHP